MRLLTALACALLLFSGNVSADAPAVVTLKVLDINPKNPAKLHAGDVVYVRVAYTSPKPVKIELMPYYQGNLSGAMALNDPTYLAAGSGETIGAFGFGEPGQVDEVRVFAVLLGSQHASTTLKLPVSLSWDEKPTQGRPYPEWITRLNAVQDQHRKALEQKALASAPPEAKGFFTTVAILYIPATLLFCLAWPIWGLVRWKEKWRWLAAVPLVVAVLKTVFMFKDLSEDPTSHDFFPLEYLILAILCAIYMTTIWFLRRRTLTRKPA